MTQDPRYPIGRFVAPVESNPQLVTQWRRELEELPILLEAVVSGLESDQLDTPYREGGWSVRQLVHHIADSHLNAYVRFKLALTEEIPTIKPYEEARWAELPDSALPIAPSLAILVGLHARWATLLEQLTPAQLDRTWFHPEHGTESPLWRSLAMYAWHGKHHTAHIAILRTERGW